MDQVDDLDRVYLGFVAELQFATFCTQVDLYDPQMLAGDYDAHFTLANMAKDSRYMLELAKAAGIETPAIAAVSARMHELSDKGMGDLDFAALGKPYLQGE